MDVFPKIFPFISRLISPRGMREAVPPAPGIFADTSVRPMTNRSALRFVRSSALYTIAPRKPLPRGAPLSQKKGFFVHFILCLAAKEGQSIRSVMVIRVCFASMKVFFSYLPIRTTGGCCKIRPCAVHANFAASPRNYSRLSYYH